MVRKSDTDRIDIYTRITDRIVEDLEQGVRPWIKPWSASNTSGRITRPVRHNGLPYSGMNVLLLWSEQMSRGFSSSMWMTFKQALELGAAVRTGESGSTVVFASRFTKAEADGSGGEIDRGSLVDEEWLLKLERKHFVELAQQEKTQARIAHMLTTGKPLRN